MRSLRVPLPDEVLVTLVELARAEYRGPRQQAAVLLIEAIEQAGRKPRPKRADGREHQP